MTRSERRSRRRFVLVAVHRHVNEEALTLTRASDGKSPLLSDDRSLTPKAVRDAHERQHGVERRFSDAKSGLHIAPILLMNPGRIHALLITHTWLCW